MDTQHYIAVFKTSPIWQVMTETVEASPWHREDNVAVHTQMCIDQYMARFHDKRTDRQNRIALIALLYHDVGKPEAEETLEKKDGSGTYRRYAGHEPVSAVAFMEAWVKDPALHELLDESEARAVRFIIEHHLPYGLKDKVKRSALRTAIAHTLREDEETFFDCLRSDAAGRISDDHETKLANVEEWIAEFKTVPLTVNKVDSKMGTCYVMVGPSGVGKSTWIKSMLRGSSKVISRDALYGSYFHSKVNIGFSQPDEKKLYADAWHYCIMVDQKGYEAFLSEEIKAKFAYAKGSHGDVFIDNTNGSKKARAKYIQAARNIGMKVVAVEFWSTFETVMARQSTRTDKHVPEKSLRQQFAAQSLTLLGSEVDEVITVRVEA